MYVGAEVEVKMIAHRPRGRQQVCEGEGQFWRGEQVCPQCM